ncbi:carboxypeptidase-like regulatory domain-containing protein, partial [Candidatus Neomarinimicrobiota bacterium]
MNNLSNKINRSTKSILTITFLLFGFVLSLSAATVTGKITNSSNGDFLPGANVLLEGTSLGAATDRAGEFTIANVPTGDYTLSVKYIGYNEYTQDITVSENVRDNNFEISLDLGFIELGDVTVSGLRQAEAKALNTQKNNDNITNVIVAEQIEAFPDPNAAEALRRLPGVSIQQDQGEGRYVLIRGTEARLNTTQINGNTLPSPEDDNRNVQ